MKRILRNPALDRCREPAATRRTVVRYMPDQLVAPILAGRQTSGIVRSLSPWAALAVLAAEICVALACGAAVLARRDV